MQFKNNKTTYKNFYIEQNILLGIVFKNNSNSRHIIFKICSGVQRLEIKYIFNTCTATLSKNVMLEIYMYF